MRSCKKIQELLKTDYLDRETSIQQDRFIKEHLKQCASCSLLEEKLRFQRGLFQGAKEQPVPGHLWNNIRQAVIAQRLKERENSLSGLLAWLKSRVLIPKPAAVLTASFLSVVIIFAIFTNAALRQQALQNKQNAAENIAGYSLNEKNGYLLYDLGTSIEEYFL